MWADDDDDDDWDITSGIHRREKTLFGLRLSGFSPLGAPRFLVPRERHHVPTIRENPTPNP